MPFRKIASPLLALPRYAKRAVALVVDCCICVLSVWLAFYLRLDTFLPLMGGPFWVWVGSLVIALPLFIVFGFYRAIFRYSGLAALKTIALAIGVYSIIYASVFTAFGVQNIPRAIGIMQPLLLSALWYWRFPLICTLLVRWALSASGETVLVTKGVNL